MRMAVSRPAPRRASKTTHPKNAVKWVYRSFTSLTLQQRFSLVFPDSPGSESCHFKDSRCASVINPPPSSGLTENPEITPTRARAGPSGVQTHSHWVQFKSVSM